MSSRLSMSSVPIKSADSSTRRPGAAAGLTSANRTGSFSSGNSAAFATIATVLSSHFSIVSSLKPGCFQLSLDACS